MNPGDAYAGAVSRVVLGRICLSLGWHGIHKTPLDIMTDLLKLSIHKLGKEAVRFAELDNRSTVILSDVEWTLRKSLQLNSEDNSLEDYLSVDFNAGASPLRVTPFPKESPTDLNFLKAGSREVLRRSAYIGDFYPPMFPEEEETAEDGDILLDPEMETKSPESSSHTGRDLREISSVIMTSAGFISPARQGKLPDSRYHTPASETIVKKEVPPPRMKSPERSKQPHLLPPPPPPPPLVVSVKEEKIHSDGSNSKKLAIFQKRTKAKNAPEETPSTSPVVVKSEVVSPSVKKEDQFDEVMNSVIEKGIEESKSQGSNTTTTTTSGGGKKKRKRPPPPEESLFSTPSSKPSKKPKGLGVPPPPPILPEPPVPSPPPPKPSTSSSSSLIPPPLIPPPTSKPPKKKEPQLVLPPPDLIQLGKHEDRPTLCNPLIPRGGQLYGFGPPETTSKKDKKDKKKHKKDKSKEEKKEKKKNKKDKEKKMLLEQSNLLLVPDKLPTTITPAAVVPQPPAPILPPPVDVPKIKIKEIKHEKTHPSVTITSLGVPSAAASRISPTPLPKEGKSKSLSSAAPTKPKLILKPPKDAAPVYEPPHVVPPVAPKKPKLDKKDFIGSATLTTVSSSSSKKTKKAKVPKEESHPSSFKASTSSSSSTLESPTSSAPSVGMITTQTVGHYVDAEGNQVWICPACGKQDDGSPMIGCDQCDDWYHWACVGISAEPAENQDWFCTRCMAKKTNFMEKKSKKKY